MKDVCAPFVGKKITVLGLGLLGRSAGDAEFLAKCGAEVIVTDIKDKGELAPSVERLHHYPNIAFHLGGHRKEDFTGCDMVLKAAGVRLDSSEVATAKKEGIPVLMSTALFAKYASEKGATIVGVTGTRGKSTISHLIYHTLVAAGRKARLGGNIRDISTLAMLPEVVAGEIEVLELDSWQLQGFGDLQISPHIAVFSNLMEDHLNYYPSMEAYFDDKANVFRYQKKDDALIVGRQVSAQVQSAMPPAKPQVPAPLPDDWTLQIPGEHNRENATLAAAALRALGLTEDEIRAGLASFEGVEGRLQFVHQMHGVKIYNDNNATTPQAALAALNSLEKQAGHAERSIVLIMGGADKGIDASELLAKIPRVCKKVLLLPGTGTDRIRGELPEAVPCDSIEDATVKSMEYAKEGDIVLFSPAFASFGAYKNEYERNDRFVKAVGEL